jgi:ATP-dependent helicase HrpA
MAKQLPQRLRHRLGPLAEFAAEFARAVPPSDLPLATALARHVRAQLSLEVPVDAFRADSAPPHLRMNFRVVDEHGRQFGMGRDLAALKRELARESEAVLQGQARGDAGERYTAWSFGDLQEIMEIRRGGHTLMGYPALVDAGDAVTLQVFDSPEKARAMHRAGVRRLLAIAFRERVRDLERALARDAALAPLKDDIVAAALDRAFLAESLPTLRAEYARRLEEGRSRFGLIAQEMARAAALLVAEHAQLHKRIAAAAKAFPQTAEEVRSQVARLYAPGFLLRTPWERLQHLPRYVKAAALRLDKLREDPQRDARLAAQVAALETPYRRELAARARIGAVTAEWEQFGWLLEELRVALFAQQLRTPVPVSAKRLAKLWQSMRNHG